MQEGDVPEEGDEKDESLILDLMDLSYRRLYLCMLFAWTSIGRDVVAIEDAPVVRSYEDVAVIYHCTVQAILA